MKSSIYLYSATGILKDKKPYHIEKIKALIRRNEAQWIVEGASAQLCHLSAEEEAEGRAIARQVNDSTDLIPHPGRWMVVHPAPDKPKASQRELSDRRRFGIIVPPLTAQAGV